MATKNISITEEAYRRLANLRRKNESFSEIIIEMTGKRAKLREFHGILSKETADAIEKSIAKARKLHNTLNKNKIEKFGRAL